MINTIIKCVITRCREGIYVVEIPAIIKMDDKKQACEF